MTQDERDKLTGDAKHTQGIADSIDAEVAHDASAKRWIGKQLFPQGAIPNGITITADRSPTPPIIAAVQQLCELSLPDNIAAKIVEQLGVPHASHVRIMGPKGGSFTATFHGLSWEQFDEIDEAVNRSEKR